jgi:hypothetical protein
LLGPIQCDFGDLQEVSKAIPGSPSIQKNESLKSWVLVRERIESYLEKSGIPCRHFKSPTYKPGDTLELLDHFVETNIPWIGSSEYQRLIQQHGIKLCLEAPYLLHTIIAFSASHLNFLRPEQRKYGIAFALHYSLSLSSYSAQLHAPLDVRKADAIIACCHLHTMLAFQNVQSGDSAVDVGGFAWLRAMQGVAILWNTGNIRPYLEGNIWRKKTLESRALENITYDHTESSAADSWASNTSRALHQLFSEQSDPISHHNSPYQEPLRRLCLLMQHSMEQDAICMFMAFIGNLPDSFVQLLGQKDPRAMLLMCYWCALLSQIDQWWIVSSAKFICRTLCNTLSKTPDQRIYNLLQFPATKCGYAMVAI